MVRYYIFLASSCAAVGIVLTFAVLLVSQRLGLDIMGKSIWVLAIPVVLSVALNIALIEMWRKYWPRKG